MYISDEGNSSVRKVDSLSGIISTVVGSNTGDSGFSGDGGPATTALLAQPTAIAFDNANDLFISDAGNSVIRRVDALTGIITTVAGQAGSESHGYSGDGGPATNATLGYAAGISLDAAGDLFIADAGNLVVRKVNALTGTISKVAGNSVEADVRGSFQPSGSNSGDGGPATLAGLSYDQDVAVDSFGNLYIAGNQFDKDDPASATVRKVTAASGSLAFGSSPVGTVSPDQIVTVTNNGNVPLAFTSLLLSENFQLDPADSLCSQSFSLNPSGTCSASIQFLPTLAGPLAGSVTLTDNDPARTQILSLSGIGIAGDAATKVVFDGVQTTLTAGGNLGAVGVSIQTSSGVIVEDSTAPVTLIMSGPDGFSHTVSTMAVDGLAAFDLATIVFDTPGAYTLTASSPDLTSAIASLVVSSVAPMPSKLAIAALPASLVQGENLGKVAVSIEYGNGTVATSATDAITLAITGPSGYSKTITENAVSGIASFDLTSDVLTAVGTYTLKATSSDLTSVTISFTLEQGFTLGLGAGSGGSGSASSTQTVVPGGTAVFALTLTPQGSSFTQKITLTASGLPPGATYSFSPSTVSLGSTPVSTSFTVVTAGRTAVLEPQ